MELDLYYLTTFQSGKGEVPASQQLCDAVQRLVDASECPLNADHQILAEFHGYGLLREAKTRAEMIFPGHQENARPRWEDTPRPEFCAEVLLPSHRRHAYVFGVQRSLVPLGAHHLLTFLRENREANLIRVWSINDVTLGVRAYVALAPA